MDAGLLHGLWTVAMIAVFAAIVVWAWSGRRKRDFDEAARLPLEEDVEDVEDVTDRMWHGWGARDVDNTARPRLEEEVTGPEKRGARHG